MLSDRFVAKLFSQTELREIYDLVKNSDIKAVTENARQLKDTYWTEAELQAEREAEAARELERKRLENEQKIQEMTNDAITLYDGTFDSLLKFLKKHDQWFTNQEDVVRIAVEYLKPALISADYMLTPNEMGDFLLFCRKLLKHNGITLGEFKEAVSNLNGTKAVDSHPCGYCEEPNGSSDPDILCRECRESFGHALFSEL